MKNPREHLKPFEDLIKWLEKEAEDRRQKPEESNFPSQLATEATSEKAGARINQPSLNGESAQESAAVEKRVAKPKKVVKKAKKKVRVKEKVKEKEKVREKAKMAKAVRVETKDNRMESLEMAIASNPVKNCMKSISNNKCLDNSWKIV